MENNFDEVRDRASRLMGEHKIAVFTGETELLTILKEYKDKPITNSEYENKTLDCIERYLLAKEKMILTEKDNMFLETLAKELREQGIRKTDASNPPLFRITNSIGEDMYYLTRSALKSYAKNSNNITTIEIPSSNSIELAELLEIIKRNF